MNLPPASWVSCSRPDPAARWRFWCLPYAGGGASSWFAWAPRLAPVAEVAALRPAGRESRIKDPPARRVLPIAEDLFARMRPYLDRPYVLAGHSLGAIVAFELTRLIRAAGAPSPGGLIVSGAPAPSTARRDKPLHGLPDAEFITQLGVKYDGIPPALKSEPELLALLLPVMRADVEAYESYEFASGAPLACPMLAMGGLADAPVPPEEVTAWGNHTTGRFEAEFFPGGHFFLQTDLPGVSQRVARFVSGL